MSGPAMRTAVIALALLLAAAAAAQEAAVSQPQGAEGHHCWPSAALYRRLGSFFCAKRPPETAVTYTVATVGPEREAAKRALLDAFAWARPASDFTEGHAAEPDVVVVVAPGPFSGPAALAGLRAQGFDPGRHLSDMVGTFAEVRRFSPPNSDGDSYDSHDAKSGRTSRTVVYRPGDRLSEADARGIVLGLLGVADMLTAPAQQRRKDDGSVDSSGEVDPRVFAPAAGGQP